MEEKKKSLGALAFNSGYPVISEFLGDQEMKLIQESPSGKKVFIKRIRFLKKNLRQT